MAQGFWPAMGQRLLFWSGWFFTVFGVIVSLYLSKEHAWIGVMVAVAGLIPLGTQSWWVHQRLAEADRQHDAALVEARRRHDEEVRRREQAEQRLAEVPADALSRLSALVSEGVVNELIGLLQRQADQIGRLRQFAAAQTKPLSVRSFQSVQGELYVLVRGLPEAVARLRPGDPFVLSRRIDTRVDLRTARLVVHQPVPGGGDLVTFRVASAVTDHVRHLTGLTGDQAVEGIKGYSVQLAVEMAALPSLDFAQVAAAIPHLAAGLPRVRGS